MKPLSILFFAFLSVLAYALPAGAQPASSEYQRGYSAGLTAGRSCAPARAPRVNMRSDFSRRWSAGYAKGHNRCPATVGGHAGRPAHGASVGTGLGMCNPDVPAYSCHEAPSQPTGGTGSPAPVQSTCNPDVPAYSCHEAPAQPTGGTGSLAPVQSTCNPDVPAYSCQTGTTTQPTNGTGSPAPVQPTCNPGVPAYSQPGCHAGANAPTAGGTPVPVQPPMDNIEACDAANPLFAGHPSPLTGKWYLYTGGSSEETWEFWGDSMFRHTWITTVGNNTRTSERGRFELSGMSLTLHVTSRSGGGCQDEIRHSTLQVLGSNGASGLVLDGTLLKYASW